MEKDIIGLEAEIAKLKARVDALERAGLILSTDVGYGAAWKHAEIERLRRKALEQTNETD